MKHPEKKIAKSIDMPGRCRKFTDMVYGGKNPDPDAYWREINEVQDEFNPPLMEYTLFCGEMHGHTDISDGHTDIDTYFRSIRDKAQLDFGGIGIQDAEIGGDDHVA